MPSPPNPLHFFCSLVREHLNQWTNFEKTFPRLHSQAAPRHRFQVQRRNQLQLPPRPQVPLRNGLQGLAAHGRVDPPYLQRCQRRKAWPKDLGPEPAAAQGEARRRWREREAMVMHGCGRGVAEANGWRVESAMSGDGNGKGELPDGRIPTASLRRLLDFLQGHWDTAEEQIHPVATFSWHQNMGNCWDRLEFAGICNQQSMNSGVHYLQTHPCRNRWNFKTWGTEDVFCFVVLAGTHSTLGSDVEFWPMAILGINGKKWGMTGKSLSIMYLEWLWKIWAHGNPQKDTKVKS